ncbi:PRC-barrel domain-containing protein [Micromonosporaceae bacterium B7E4]
MIHGGGGAFVGGTPAGEFDPWRYRDDAGVTGADLVGYKVEATDGGIGKIDSASHDVNVSYLVVDTGPWIFGKKVMLPAGVVNHVDHDDRKVYVDRSKDQIKAAPEFDGIEYEDPAYRDKLGGYYGGTYGPSGWTIPPGRAM